MVNTRHSLEQADLYSFEKWLQRIPAVSSAEASGLGLRVADSIQSCVRPQDKGAGRRMLCSSRLGFFWNSLDSVHRRGSGQVPFPLHTFLPP